MLTRALNVTVTVPFIHSDARMRWGTVWRRPRNVGRRWWNLHWSWKLIIVSFLLSWFNPSQQLSCQQKSDIHPISSTEWVSFLHRTTDNLLTLADRSANTLICPSPNSLLPLSAHHVHDPDLRKKTHSLYYHLSKGQGRLRKQASQNWRVLWRNTSW